MTWKTTYYEKRKRALPNHLQKNPTISFRFNSEAEILSYIRLLSKRNQKTSFVNQAISMRYFYLMNRTKFIETMIREDYDLVRQLLRKEGNRRSAVTTE